jgi:hypothetical protein
MRDEVADFPRLEADEDGVWIQFHAAESSKSLLAWGDIRRVSGYRVEGIGDQTDLFLVLDTEYGEFLELYDGLAGFSAVTSALPTHLPGVPSDWLQRH